MKSSVSKKRTNKAKAKQEKKSKKASPAKSNPLSMSLRLDEEVEQIDVDQVFDEINNNYVSKLLNYLRGQAAQVSSHTEFTKVYQLIIHHCDNQDHNDEVFNCFKRFVQTYFDSELLPKLKNPKNDLLSTMCQVWENFTIYAKMMDRCFDYLNRYYLSNSSMPPIGANCLQMFKQLVFQKYKKPVCEAILKQITKDREGEVINRETVKKTI